MNNASKWRLALSKEIARIYSQNSMVKAIGVGGSVSWGSADPYSDIDLLLFCTDFPSDNQRQVATEQVKARNIQSFRPAGLFIREHYFVGDAKIDASYLLIEMVESIIEAIAEQYDTDPLKQKLAVALLDMIPLHGSDLIELWRAKVAKYPEGLAKAMVEKHLLRYPLWVLQAQGVQRDDVLYLHELLWPIVQNLFGICLGLNRMYHPSGFKHISRHIERMQIVPQDFSSRLKKIFQTTPQSALEEASQLIEETICLVESHIPDIDTSSARDTLNAAPEMCEHPPEGIA